MVSAVPRLFCLVDVTDDVALLPDLAGAGVDGFQVRAKSLADGALVSFTRGVIEAVRPHGAVVVVNDRVDVALAGGADGVHLGRTDLPVADARRIAPGLLVGATCRSRDHAAEAARDGADYAGIGPVFASASKRGLPDPLGVPAVETAAGELPLVAIGGISVADVPALRAAGAHGVAVIAAIWGARDPVGSAKELVAELA
ncbi:thiamine phosphate synthase [Nocardioides sp.]|uniref:thiamine phosphate synthase n=1 Tax=Nocardioides sp. TaxID=35761 RepID=UPI002736573A|nr:thiamine phosphate synthase [Nocardioides sp.]MDP3890400.1 thiamine phosphate synthase [Nocardioides sp.]